MKIVVLGAGALGAYFGARWEQSGQDVVFLVRPKRAQQLRQSGILIHSVEGDYAIEAPNVIEDASEVDTADLVLLAVKGYHLQDTISQLKTLTAKGARVLPVLNGIEHLPILQEQLGEEAVLGGLSFIIATLDNQGDVVHASSFHDLRFGPLHPSQQALCQQIESVSRNAKMNAKQADDISLEMWNKYMFITAFSGITTATDSVIGEVRKRPSTFRIAEKILEDMTKLANANNIPLNKQHVEKAMDNLRKFDEDATSSMHQDRRKGLRLEVEHLHGGAIRLAEQSGLELPYVETIYGILKRFENKD
ncbi:2-dehydropantoate 2-reductase [Aquibacillus albus]|uniref:2-dehydropantoate 2-reductase n=1 Tax=Aquibacillus albus TaxID=1168171 RepID=A0ABS2MYZ9_9BACI|nr:2-dehydropantoate 2-reductase [Aquibacillus albus]